MNKGQARVRQVSVPLSHKDHMDHARIVFLSMAPARTFAEVREPLGCDVAYVILCNDCLTFRHIPDRPSKNLKVGGAKGR